MRGPEGRQLRTGQANQQTRLAPADLLRHDERFVEARRQLDEYFAGERKTFDQPLHLSGTDFQVQVLAELQRIPYGETTSYGAIAKRIGRPKAMRAVGAANGRNPA